MVRAKPTFIAMAALSAIGLLALAGLRRLNDFAVSDAGRPGLISRFERRQPPLRRPASEAPRCARDRLSLSQVREEVGRMEKIRTGAPIQGVWEKKDLAKMPLAAAQFLSAYGKWIAADGQDFTACEGIPCIINRVYGLEPDAAPGWNAYGWYLRTGYSLSFKNYIPSGMRDEIDFGDLRLSSFLFSAAELGNFWKLGLTLPESFLNMGSLQTLHRVPSGFRLPMWTDRTCGDAWGSKNRGYVRVGDRCMFVADEPKNFEGFFYVGVPHEMAHRYDAWKGEGWSKDISDRAEWKEFSGWRSQTVVEDGKVKEEKWYPDPAKEGFVREYAGVSPAEDWADTLAHFRYRPDTALKVSPLKSEYISRMVFENRSFDTAGLLKHYGLAMTQAVSVRLLESVMGCLANPEFHAPATTGGSPEHLELGPSVPAPIRECLERGVRLHADNAAAALRADEWEACDTFDAPGGSRLPELRRQVATAVTPDAARYLAENAARAPMLQAGIKLRRALQETTDVREIYRHCVDQVDQQSCYDSALAEAFARAAQPFAADLGDWIVEERNLYAGQHPLSDARTQVESFYRQFFAGIEPSVTAAARQRWEACLAAPSPDPSAPLLTRPYTGGAHFVSAAILDCINSQSEGDLDRVREAFAARLGFGAADEPLRKYARGLLLPSYLETLRGLQDPAAQSEDEERERRKPGVIDVLVGGLQASSLSFGAVPTVEGAIARCLPDASRAFDEYFGRVGSGDQLPTRFAAIEDLRTGWSTEACARVVRLPLVQEKIRAQASLAWDAAIQVLERAVAARAKDRATDCIARSPGVATQRLVRDRRRQCLLLPSAWITLETQALVDWEQSGEGRIFIARKSEAQKLMIERRKAWQANAAAALDKR